MKIVISSGHGTKIRGAAGSPVPPYCDEVDEAIRVVGRVAEFYRAAGVDVVTYTDTVSDDQSENLNRIVDFHNSQGPHDLDISVHFNAYQQGSKPMGTEVLWVTQEELAADVAEAISDASGLINRGPKYRSDLFFLNNTAESSILVEVAFCDSTSDCDLYRLNFDKICKAIAETTADVDVPDIDQPPEVPPEVAGPPSTAQPTLGMGDSGEAVARLQQSLGIPIDGDFGPVTDAQVRAFQAAAELVADGIVGPMTWSEIDALDERMAKGTNGVPPELAVQVAELASASKLARYEWPGRGLPPEGYVPGMALAFAVAMELYFEDKKNVKIMAQAAGDPDFDALAWLADDFANAGMSNARGGLDTLRHLFVLLVGLGMRESSGNYSEGRDQSTENTTADTCESGLMQTSWNINVCSNEIAKLLEEYWLDPNGFLPMFQIGISPNADDLQVFGSGEGARYQFLAKYSPIFAVLVTAIGLRLARSHWGPVNRKEVTLTPVADRMLRDVQRLVEEYSPDVA